jgi:hypothetical protein
VSDSFFKRHDHLQEEERRLLSQKWNTVMHHERGKRVSSLNAPCFDIHYIAREPGQSISPSDAPEIHYALVVVDSGENAGSLRASCRGFPHRGVGLKASDPDRTAHCHLETGGDILTP